MVLDYAEMEQKIKDFAEEAAESLYGINLKDWASQLGDVLYEAWKKGEDGAEAFKKKSVELIGEVMNEMLKVGYLMPRMQEIQKKLFGEDGESGYFGADGKLDEYEIADIGKDLMGLSDASEKWSKTYDQLYDWVKRNYGKEAADALKGGGEESSGLSKDIQGVTENTADLLASYLNGVRADVAAEVMLARQIVDEYFPRSNFLAEAQLNELRAISANTAANAEFAEEIRDILKRAQNGTLPFKVR